MIVAGGTRHELAGVETFDFTQDPRYRLSREGWRPRKTAWIRSIGIHTRLGMPVKLQPGRREGPRGRPGWDEQFAGRMNRDGRYAGAHIAVDGDGSAACVADVRRAAAYHAGPCNDVSVGLEMYQDAQGRVWQATIDTTVRIVDLLTRVLRIQRQIVREVGICRRFARPTRGTKRSHELAYMEGGASGADFVGVWGHRNATRNRGPGDPGDEIMLALQGAGYEPFWVDQGEDLDTWAKRQIDVGFHEDMDCDGIPGPFTASALEHYADRPHGLWVSRPGD